MLQVEKSDKRLRFRFSSEFALVPKVVSMARDAFSFPTPAGSSRLSVVMRELLMNALEHGNRHEARRFVQCEVEQTSPGGFTVQVEDEGWGFDHRSLNLNLPDNPAQVMRRGYALLGALCYRLEFNEKGNRVKAYCAVDREEYLPDDVSPMASAS